MRQSARDLVYVAIALCFIAAMLILVACDPTDLDNGRIEIDGVELYGQPPLGVFSDDTIDRALVAEAMQWWGDETGEELFVDPVVTPSVLISIGFVPSDFDPELAAGDEAGIAHLTYDADGLITSCEITISSDIAYHEETVLEALKHELGHCLGLADDPNSLDLNSIMSSPMAWRGEVTDLDRELALEDLR